MSFDAVVVGAGPAGSAAAYHLARRGRSVLLVERRAFPRDKCCGDGLTRGAVRQLAEMGVLPDLADAQRVGGVRVHMRGKGARDFPYSGFGLVLPRFDLDARLCARAVEAGATLWTAQVSGPIGGPSGVRGIEMIRDGRRTRVEAPVVVAADGAASRLARQTGLRPPGREWTGFAARAYYAGIKGTDDLLQIVLPLTDVTDKHLLPSYGWIFPLGQGRANVGVGLFGPMNPEGLRGMFDRFVADLAELDPGFATATREGPMSGAPLRLDFEPERCGVPGLLLAGDAAGLISPFTGEGISYALESGALAAAHIDATLPGPILPGPYARRLAARYGGYFEAGRHSVRRYQLAWRVLDATFDDDRPLFTLCRRLALFPDGARTELVLPPLPPPDPELSRMLRRDLLAVAELLADCVRADWPMFVRLSGVTDDLSAQTVRPSVLLLLASYLGGGERHPLIHALAAAADLGLLAALATDGTREERSSSGLPWGNRFSVLVADFFLARAFDFAAKAGGAVTADFSRALAAACQARARELRAGELGLPEYAEMLEGKLAIAFELPCRLGARLSGAPPATVTALAAYGRHLGVSFALIDDLRDGPGDADPAELRALAAEHAGLAHAALSVLPAGPVVDLLSALSGSVV